MASVQAAIEALTSAESIRAIGFYVSKAENRAPELNCRLWESTVKFLSRERAEVFANELNEAIQPVLQRWIDERLNVARVVVNSTTPNEPMAAGGR